MPLPENRELIAPEDLEIGVEYAVQPFTGDWTSLPLRPCRGVPLAADSPLVAGSRGYAELAGDRWLQVWRSDDDIPTLYLASKVHVLGQWDDRPSGPVLDSPLYHPMTWRQIAAHAYGEVLRHNELVDRLAKLGIERQKEPYLVTPETPSALYRSLTLNYDELDKLLTKAGA